MTLINRAILAASLAAAAPGFAIAADLPAPAPAPATYAPASAPNDWTVTVGLEGRAVPAWPGAPETMFGFTPVPLFSIRKAGTPPDFFGARDSFGFPILDLGQWKFGPAFQLVWERRASDYWQLNGLGNVDYALQVGGFAEYWPVPWMRLHGEVRQGIGGETGVTGDLFLDAVVPFGQFRFSAGPRVTVQSASAVTPYFSITAAQSAASGLPVYSASGGLYSYGAGTQLEYFWNPQWSAHVLAEYQRLTGSSADSPLVTLRGSPNQFTFGMGATYSFNMHSLW